MFSEKGQTLPVLMDQDAAIPPFPAAQRHQWDDGRSEWERKCCGMGWIMVVGVVVGAVVMVLCPGRSGSRQVI